ncbi:hypothetical protein [Kitasatospora cinereorecta]|uniref:MarR family transcriptional regulator n=1 Tax=Kitasatospora cinereorecta TaxID=285560 RepID=A0ABW0V6T4_9ACTN
MTERSNHPSRPEPGPVRAAMIDLLTHQPFLGFAVDDLAVRLVSGELRFDWWYSEVVKQGRAEGLWCTPTELGLEYAETTDRLEDAWERRQSGELSDDAFVAVLRETVVTLEDWLDRVPGAPWRS